MVRTINFGDSEVDARYQIQDTDPDGGDLVLARDLDNNSLALLRYDGTDDEWEFGGSVSFDGNDLSGVGSATVEALEADSLNNADLANAPPETVLTAVGDGSLEMVDFGSDVEFEQFTNSGTWEKPDDVNVVYVECVGGGGGGGAGSNNFAAGGEGGQGGAVAMEYLNADNVESSVDVQIGAGGVGGSPIEDGDNGGDTTFGDRLTAEGGIGGEERNRDQTPNSRFEFFSDGAGGFTDVDPPVSSDGFGRKYAGGGGGGGSESGGDITPGGDGGIFGIEKGHGAAGGETGNTGDDAAEPLAGGGGGGAVNDGDAPSGGDGLVGGGGGGGATTGETDDSGGDGGDGGDGRVRIWAW